MEDKLYLVNVKKVTIITKKGSVLEVEDISSIQMWFEDTYEEKGDK